MAIFSNPKIIIGISLTGILISGFGLYLLKGSESFSGITKNNLHDDLKVTDETSEELTDPPADPSDRPPEIYASVYGAVKSPGVYKMPGDSRIFQLIDRAGGYSGNVSLNHVNTEIKLAMPLTDGASIYVPFVHDAVVETSLLRKVVSADSPTGIPAPGGGSDKYDKCSLNSASREQLEAIKGIGPAYASRIIAARPLKNLDVLKTDLKLPTTVVNELLAACTL